MTVQTLSITRLLVMKKTTSKSLEALLQRASRFKFSEVVKKGTLTPEVETRIKRNQQALFDQINAQSDLLITITSAIARSNAETEVIVAGRKMTVAEAIARKDQVKDKMLFISSLGNSIESRDKELLMSQTTIDNEVNKRTNTALGGERGASLSADVTAGIRQAVESQFATTVVCWNTNLDQEYTKLRDSLMEFVNDVDTALNESNATTKVTIAL